MRESVTYQAILDEGRREGRLQELHRILLRQGRKRFGEPDDATREALEQIRSVKRLELLSERLLEVSDWNELLR